MPKRAALLSAGNAGIQAPPFKIDRPALRPRRGWIIRPGLSRSCELYEDSFVKWIYEDALTKIKRGFRRPRTAASAR